MKNEYLEPIANPVIIPLSHGYYKIDFQNGDATHVFFDKIGGFEKIRLLLSERIIIIEVAHDLFLEILELPIETKIFEKTKTPSERIEILEKSMDDFYEYFKTVFGVHFDDWKLPEAFINLK